jgi:outer membrane protein OmpA-like peptidoglycan-associated protein
MMLRSLVLMLALLVGACAATPKRDLDLERLSTAMAELSGDPVLGPLGGRERAMAEDALRRLREAPEKDRPHLAYVAQRRVDMAYAAAQAEQAEQQIVQLEREHDRILLEASRRDAELARLEAEKLRLQSLARAEESERMRVEFDAARERGVELSAEAERARREADQARRMAEAQQREATAARREADLASAAAEALRIQLQSLVAREEDRGLVMTLGETVFAPGQSELRREARANLGAVVQFISENPGKRVRIEGHTDSTGNRNANQVLSQRRAEAVRRALIEDGVDGGRLEAVGLGQDFPVAPNDTAEGRARNRRVEIIIDSGV